MPQTLRAGVHKMNITPPVGVDLTGYGGRPSGCTSIHDNVYAGALILSDGDTTLALVSMDALGIDFDVRDEIRTRVEAETGIPAKALLLNSSHTHAGPATESLRGLGERDPAYVADFIESVVSAVKTAHENLQPAKIGHGRAPVQIGTNRRQRLSDGRMTIGKNPDGVIVPYADILRVDGEDGEPLAVWFTHACHPTTLGGGNLAVSAEFCGVAVGVVEAIEGCPALFAQGCGGDINPRRGGSFEAVRMNGRILGAAAIGVVEAIEATETAPILDAAIAMVPLPFQEPTPLDQVDAMIASFQYQVEEAIAKGMHRGHVWLRQAWLDWAKAVRVYSADAQNAPTHCPFEVQVLRIGDFAVVGLPGEVFAEYAVDIAERSPFGQTAVLGYTNGCHGYVPTHHAYPLGGYEVNDAIRYYGTLMFAPESDPVLRDGTLRMLREIARQ